MVVHGTFIAGKTVTRRVMGFVMRDECAMVGFFGVIWGMQNDDVIVLHGKK